MHALQLVICKATCSANDLQPLHSPPHIGRDEYNDDNDEDNDDDGDDDGLMVIHCGL